MPSSQRQWQRLCSLRPLRLERAKRVGGELLRLIFSLLKGREVQRYVAQIIIPFLLFFADPPIASTAEDLPDLALQTVTKTHSEIIRESPHAWKILVGGVTPVANESIQIEVLEGKCPNPRLRSSGSVDFSSLTSIVCDVTSPDMTEEQKARALWRFVMNNCYGGRWGTSADGLEHLNVYGYGYCGTFAAALEPLWWATGLRARHINIGNHAATEAYYENDWHYLDAHRREFFLERGNGSIASLEDLNRDLYLWDMKRHRKPSQESSTKYYYMTMHPRGHGRSPIYSRDFTMVKGDQLTLTWEKRGEWCLARGAEGGGKPAPEPPIYANGVFQFQRDWKEKGVFREGLVSSENANWEDTTSEYLHPSHTKTAAHLTYRIRVPYFISKITVSGKFYRKNSEDLLSIDLSTDEGKHWNPIWKAFETGLLQANGRSTQTQEVTTEVPWKYSYLLRVRMRAEKNPSDVGIFFIQSDSNLVYNPRSLPGLRSGDNTLIFSAEQGQSCSTRVTYRWMEALPIQCSNEHPMEGEEVTLSASVTNVGTGDAQNVPVVFYSAEPTKKGLEIGRGIIDRIRPGATALAKVKWKATRKMGKSYRTPGANIHASVDPDNAITETDESNDDFSRLLKVMNPPEVAIPNGSFINFDKKNDNADIITVTATVRNFSSWRDYGFYLSDHTDAEGVVVRFFDGKPGDRNQIGLDRVIERLKPLEFQNVCVDWDISRLKGIHDIHVQVLPPKNLVRALGNRTPAQAVRSVDLDVYRTCNGN